ncbi:unnamed protein product, partial [marine sediment metagenome]
KEICESDSFWRRKLEKDYPQEIIEVRKKGIEVIKNPKNIYIRRFTSVAYKIEKFISVLINFYFGERYNQFLSKEYKEQLFKAIYTGYENIIYSDFSNFSTSDIEDIKSHTIQDEIALFLPSPKGYETTYTQTKEFYNVILPKFINEILKENIYELIKE